MPMVRSRACKVPNKKPNNKQLIDLARSVFVIFSNLGLVVLPLLLLSDIQFRPLLKLYLVRAVFSLKFRNTVPILLLY